MPFRYVDEYENTYKEAETDEAKYVGNPINSFRLIKSLTSDWKNVNTLVRSNTSITTFVENINQATDNFHLLWPNHDDLSGAAMAIERLQDVYAIKTSDMAEGKLSGKTFEVNLSANDCFQIGNQSYYNGNKSLAIEWVEYSIKKLDQEGDNPTVDRIDVYHFLAGVFYKLDDPAKTLYYVNLKLTLKQNDVDVKRKKNLEDYQNTAIPIKKKERHERYISLCRDEGQLDER